MLSTPPCCVRWPFAKPARGHPWIPFSGNQAQGARGRAVRMPRKMTGPAARLVADSRYAGGSVSVLPRTRRRSICDSRNPSSPAVTAGQPPRVKLHGSCTRQAAIESAAYLLPM